MRAKWMLAALLLTTFTAHAGKPPIFKPDYPMGWSWQQKQAADKALDVLFDTCPALAKWLPDMDSANVYTNDLSKPINSNEREMLASLGWSNVMVVTIFTVNKPLNPIFEGDHTSVDFYLGTGKRTGIFMQGGFFPQAACGAKPTSTFRWAGDRSNDKSEEPDTFIAAPALMLLKNM